MGEELTNKEVGALIYVRDRGSVDVYKRNDVSVDIVACLALLSTGTPYVGLQRRKKDTSYYLTPVGLRFLEGLEKKFEGAG